MSRWLIFILVVVASLVLQASILPVHLEPAFKPDLLLILTVFLALRGAVGIGVPCAWGLGLVKDAFSGLYLGLNAFSFLIIYIVIKHLSDRLYAESGSVFVVAVSGATLACVAINLLLMLMFTSTPSIIFSAGANLFPHLLVNAFAASLIILHPRFAHTPQAAK